MSDTILTHYNVNTLDGKAHGKDVEFAAITKQLDKKLHSDTIHKYNVTDEQKKLVAQVHFENINKQKHMIKESITPVGNNVIVEVKLATSIIELPDQAKLQGNVEHIKLWKVSDKVKEERPELVEGKYCNVNLSLLLQMRVAPCYEDGDLVYFKVSSEQIEYLYDKA